MAHAQPRARVARRLPAGRRREQRLDVERAREHPDALARGRGRPRVARAVRVELDPVPVRVGQVDRLRDAVVGGAGDRGVGQRKALDRACELLARGVQQRVVVEPGVAAGGPRARLLVEHHEVLPARAERRDGVFAAVQPQPEPVLVEADRAVEAGDGEVHGAQPERRGQGGAGGGLDRGHGYRMGHHAIGHEAGRDPGHSGAGRTMQVAVAWASSRPSAAAVSRPSAVATRPPRCRPACPRRRSGPSRRDAGRTRLTLNSSVA